MAKLSIQDWKSIFHNIKNASSDEKEEFGDWVEVIWLEGTDEKKEEYVLAYGYECFEDGFKTEEEARERLLEIERSVFN